MEGGGVQLPLHTPIILQGKHHVNTWRKFTLVASARSLAVSFCSPVALRVINADRPVPIFPRPPYFFRYSLPSIGYWMVGALAVTSQT